MMAPCPIRAHHGMCLYYFRGHGYSSGFTGHMAAMKTFLEEENPMIELLTEVDSICSACPNNQNGICDDQQKVIEYDQRVLQACGLQAHTVMPFLTFEKLVTERILRCGKREQICGNCEWSALCRPESGGSHDNQGEAAAAF